MLPRGASQREHTDLLVVGAGIIGTLITHLAARDSRMGRITLVDALEPGRQTTGRSAGLLTRWGTSEVVRELANRSVTLYAELAARGDLDGLVSQPLVWMLPRGDVDSLLRCHPSPLSRADESAVHGSLAIDTREYELYADHGHVLAAATAVSGMIRRLREQGVQCWHNQRVDKLEIDGDRVHASLSDGTSLSAARCVLATGPWLDLALGLVPGADEIRTKRVVSVHCHVAPRASDVAIMFPARDAFLLPLHAHGHWLFSYRSDVWDERPDDMCQLVTAADVAAARTILDQLAPTAAAHIAGGQVFCDAYHPARVPQVLRAERAPLVAVTGASGSGARLAPALAERALALLMGETS